MNKKLAELERFIREYDGPPVHLMEVCGTHTHQISKFGISRMLSERINLISGPGCPVCVTPAGYMDRAAEISLRNGCTLLCYGDIMRVPGRRTSILRAKSEGGSVGLIYSPMEALRAAESEPDRTFYVTAVGFETTLPLYALALRRMEERGIGNVRFLMAARALMPALEWLCSGGAEIDGLIGPGHVSAIIGSNVYQQFCKRYRKPLVVAGFSYEHLIAAIAELVGQCGRGGFEARNLYPGVVTGEGNGQALALIDKYFERRHSQWRGLGGIDGSGYFLRPEYARFDGGGFEDDGEEAETCLCGSVITGRARPVDCPYFGIGCTPESPIGPCMVSSEGACGIWMANSRVR